MPATRLLAAEAGIGIAAPLLPPAAGREMPLRFHVLLARGGQLPDVVGATGPPAALASRLHGRQEQADECADDGDDDEQLNEREARLPTCVEV